MFYAYSLDNLELLISCTVALGFCLIKGVKSLFKVSQADVALVGTLMRLNKGLIYE